MDGMTPFSEKVPMLARRKGLSQAELARAIGTYPQRVSEWIGGRGAPSMVQALRMARALGVPLDYLVDDEQDHPPENELSEDERIILSVIRDTGLSRQQAIRALVQARNEEGMRPPAASHAPGYWPGGEVQDMTKSLARQIHDAARPKRKEPPKPPQIEVGKPDVYPPEARTRPKKRDVS